GLDLAEDVAEGFGGAAGPADDQAVDDELVEERDDGGEGILEVADDEVVINRIEIEEVAEERDGYGVLGPATVEGESGEQAEDEGNDGGTEDDQMALRMAFGDGAVGIERVAQEGEAGDDGHERQHGERHKHQR